MLYGSAHQKKKKKNVVWFHSKLSDTNFGRNLMEWLKNKRRVHVKVNYTTHNWLLYQILIIVVSLNLLIVPWLVLYI